MEPSPAAVLVLSCALGLIMFALGTTLRGEQFRLVFTQPRAIIVGLVNLLLIAPGLAFAVAYVVGLDPIFAAGLVLLGAAPGGVLANLLTHAARGNTALSVSMTAISSTAAIVTVPLWLGTAVAVFDVRGAGIDLEMASIVARVLATIALPLAAGMVLATRAPRWVERHRIALERLAFATFLVVVLAAIAANVEIVLANVEAVAGAAVLLNLAAMGIGLLAARVARLSAGQTTAIAIELGVHNAALAVAIGASIDERLAVPAAVYSSFMVFTAGAFAWWMSRRSLAT